ncbi:MAG: hypothetical protein GVY29_01355 [Spirochaetes bacterium]|jgi:hypothetical protein|nr:hypothetical protein [Spirochaetota bacterium]
MAVRRGLGRSIAIVLGVAALLLTACQVPFGADNAPGSADEPSDPPEAPTFDPAGGSFSTDVEVALATATEGARIHYTRDGSTPGSGSPEYNGPIAVSDDQTTVTISAVAVLDGRPNSAVVSETYTIDYSQTSTPQFNPPPGTVETDVDVEISSSTAGATIYYTTNGDDPDPDDTSGSTEVYSGPIAVTGNGTSRTIRAIAQAPGFTPSTIAEATYTVDYVQAAAPTFAPEPGPVYEDFDVEITTATPGASIYYTTNGDDPDPSDLSGPTALYSGPIPVTGDGTVITVKAIAGGPNFIDSEVVEASYTITYPLVVTSNAPTGPGSINDVLANAPSGSVVTFAEGITTIVATETLPEGPAPTWSDLSKDITIDGEDKGIVLDAAGFGRHFTIRGGATLTLRNLTLRGGLGRRTDGVPTAGGSVYVYIAHLVAENVTFLNNVTTKSSSQGADGGAVEINAAGTGGAATALLRDSVFENNAAGKHGGAISVIQNGRATIDNVTFRGNTAAALDENTEYGGGAVYSEVGSPVWISGSHFENNGVTTALRAVGGAVAIRGWMSVTDSTFVRNYAKLGGGAIYAWREAGLQLHAGRFYGNFAENNGGAVSSISDAVFDPNIRINSSVFVGNRVSGAGAGAIWLASTSHVSASSFAENVSDSGEQDIYVSKGAGVTNSIILNDTVRSGTWVRWSVSESDLSGYGSDNVQAAIAVAENPDPGDGTWGTEADNYGDLTPVPGSLSIDAGSTALLLADQWDLDGDGDGGETVPYDILGNPREVGSAVDMGAYEKQSQ